MRKNTALPLFWLAALTGWGGPFYGPYGGMGWGWGFNRPYNVNTTTSGVLYIDLIDATSKKLIWQGKGVGRLSGGTPQERANFENLFIPGALHDVSEN